MIPNPLSPPLVGRIQITPRGTWGQPRPKRGAGKTHRGIDFAAARGAPVLAVADGTITRIGWDKPTDQGGGGGGNFVVIRHAWGDPYPWETAYMHLDSTIGAEGQPVRAGQQIGTAGDSGAPSGGVHLHFELRRYPTGEREHVDPTRFFQWTAPPNVASTSPAPSTSPPLASYPPASPPEVLASYQPPDSLPTLAQHTTGNGFGPVAAIVGAALLKYALLG